MSELIIALFICITIISIGFWIGTILFPQSYHSETKAYDVNQHLRCDFYIEYNNSDVYNITLTECIFLP